MASIEGGGEGGGHKATIIKRSEYTMDGMVCDT